MNRVGKACPFTIQNHVKIEMSKMMMLHNNFVWQLFHLTLRSASVRQYSVFLSRLTCYTFCVADDDELTDLAEAIMEDCNGEVCLSSNNPWVI